MNTVKTTFRPTILSQSITAILLSGSLLSPAAHAARINIPAGSLDHAIQLLAQQTGIVIAADGQHTRQLKVPAVSGELSASQALQQLLGGSTLEAIRQKDGSYLLRPLTELPKIKVSATAPATADQTVATGMNEARLDTIRVSAAANVAAETATSPVRGYVAKRSATATKTDTPIIETPQSISVVGAEEIKAIGATTVMEALAYTPGVVNTEGFNPGVEKNAMRGFEQRGATLRDGLSYGGTFGKAGYQEIYGLERIEYLKGAASVLYGQQSPGGVINAVSKRAQKDQVQELVMEYGSHDHQTLKMDIGGQITNDILWRLTSLANKENTQVNHIARVQKVSATINRLFPSMTWRGKDHGR